MNIFSEWKNFDLIEMKDDVNDFFINNAIPLFSLAPLKMVSIRPVY